MKRFHVTIKLDWEVDTELNKFDLCRREMEVVKHLKHNSYFPTAKYQVEVTEMQDAA